MGNAETIRKREQRQRRAERLGVTVNGMKQEQRKRQKERVIFQCKKKGWTVTQFGKGATVVGVERI